MKKLNNKGFGIVEILLLVVLVGVIGGAVYYVYNSQKKTNTALENAAKSQAEPQKSEEKEEVKDPNEGYIVIKEWGVKIPLTNETNNAYYKFEDGHVYLQVDLDGDNNKACSNQAALSKVTNFSEGSDNFRERPSELEKIGVKIDNAYYYLEGSQSTCSQDEIIQTKATAVRTAWLKQNMRITTAQ